MIAAGARDAVVKAVLYLAEVFDTAVSPTRLQAYVDALHDLPTAALARAVQAATRGHRRFPLPAELRQYATETKPPPPTALLAGPGERHPAAREMLALMGDFLAKRVPKRDYLDRLRRIHARYPDFRDAQGETLAYAADRLAREWGLDHPPAAGVASAAEPKE